MSTEMPSTKVSPLGAASGRLLVSNQTTSPSGRVKLSSRRTVGAGGEHPLIHRVEDLQLLLVAWMVVVGASTTSSGVVANSSRHRLVDEDEAAPPVLHEDEVGVRVEDGEHEGALLLDDVLVRVEELAGDAALPGGGHVLPQRPRYAALTSSSARS